MAQILTALVPFIPLGTRLIAAWTIHGFTRKVMNENGAVRQEKKELIQEALDMKRLEIAAMELKAKEEENTRKENERQREHEKEMKKMVSHLCMGIGVFLLCLIVLVYFLFGPLSQHSCQQAAFRCT